MNLFLSKTDHSYDIKIVIFKIMGTYFGIDMDQISEILSYNNQKENFNFLWFHKNIWGKKIELKYKSPIILVRKDSIRNTGIIIDQILDIDVHIPIELIQPLPILIEKALSFSPIWSVILKQEKIIFLIDLYKFT